MTLHEAYYYASLTFNITLDGMTFIVTNKHNVVVESKETSLETVDKDFDELKEKYILDYQGQLEV